MFFIDLFSKDNNYKRFIQNKIESFSFTYLKGNASFPFKRIKIY